MAKTFYGKVTSNAADKTIVVTVSWSKSHPLYRKQFTKHSKLMAHDEKNEAGLGDRVEIVEVRPISAHKRYKLTKIMEKAAVEHVETEPEILVKEEVVEEPKAEVKAKTTKKVAPAKAAEDKK